MTEQQTFALLLGEAAMAVWGICRATFRKRCSRPRCANGRTCVMTSPAYCMSATPERSIRPSPRDADLYCGNATSAITGRWSEYARALRSVQAEQIDKSREA